MSLKDNNTGLFLNPDAGVTEFQAKHADLFPQSEENNFLK